MSVSDRLPYVSALVMDIDGVLTDGTITWSSDGSESKKYSFEDIMGLSRARSAGIVLGLISGEGGPLVERLAEKIRAVYVVADCKDKASALKDFSASLAIPLEQVVYIGDDINDLGALALAGISAAPANAQQQVKQSVALVLERSGGDGAIRQLTEILIATKSASV